MAGAKEGEEAQKEDAVEAVEKAVSAVLLYRVHASVMIVHVMIAGAEVNQGLAPSWHPFEMMKILIICIADCWLL